MAKLGWVKFVCLVALPVAALAVVAACSSSSNTAGPGSEGGAPEASVSTDAGTEGAAPDAGPAPMNDGGISLTWGVALVRGGRPPSDAGADGSGYGVTDGGEDAPAPIPEDAGYYNGNDGGSPAVVGAQVCVFTFASVEAAGGWTLPAQSGALDCVTTAADGTFVVPSLPIRTNLVLTVSKRGYVPVLLSIQTASSPMDVRQYPVFLYDPSTEVDLPGVVIDYQDKGQICSSTSAPRQTPGPASRWVRRTTPRRPPVSGPSIRTIPATWCRPPRASCLPAPRSASASARPSTSTSPRASTR